MLPIVAYSDRHALLPALFDRSGTRNDEVDSTTQQILHQVRDGGDAAIAELTERFDGIRPTSLRVEDSAIEMALARLPVNLLSIFEDAADNIRRFHERQMRESWYMDDGDGVVLGQRFLPIDRAGLYVPGGTAAYPSSVLMNAIPAQVAGVREIHLASPPGPDGQPHHLVLAAARLLGIESIYAVGGAQAVGAFAYGTESIPKVDKIVGPGNAYVAAAKKLVYGQVDIDSIAGPSEIVVVADDTADAEYAAVDMLAQAEHDRRSSAVLLTTSEGLAERVRIHIQALVPELPRSDLIQASLREFGACIVTSTLEEAIEVVNELAPEHLELHVADPWTVLASVRHAGAVFLGPHSPEPVGDYFAGPNHVLPTSGTARYASALGVDDFLRRQSVIAYSRQRLMRTGAAIASFARAEQLDAHALAVDARVNRREKLG